MIPVAMAACGLCGLVFLSIGLRTIAARPWLVALALGTAVAAIASALAIWSMRGAQ